MSCRFHPAARGELTHATRWYLGEAGKLIAADFAARVRHATRLLEKLPHLGARAHSEVQFWPLPRYPYTLVYRVEPDGIVILAVAHQRREPGYWEGR